MFVLARWPLLINVRGQVFVGRRLLPSTPPREDAVFPKPWQKIYLTEDNWPDPTLVNCSKEKQRGAEGNPPPGSQLGQGSVSPFPTLGTGTVASCKALWDTFTASPMSMQVLSGGGGPKDP